MNDLIQLGILLLSIFSLSSLLIWPRIKLSWLQQVVRGITITLPFERIPSLELGGVSIRISQLLVLVGAWFFLILLAKNDPKILSMKIKKVNIVLFTFLVVSIPSFFAIVNQTRFLTTLIATLIAFGATFLISQFETNPFKRIKELTITLSLVSIFGAYQFFGDLAGIPASLTGLREQYTKIVFGIPRVQATALEPLYFAGMLFLPIFASLIFTAFRQRIVTKTDNFFGFLTTNTSLFIFLTLIFLATYSKAAIVILGAMLLFILIFLGFKVNTNQLIKKILLLGGILTTLATGIVLYIPRFRSILTVVVNFFIETLLGRGVSAEERLAFLRAFWKILPENIVTGIGSGQYGPRAVEFIPSLGNNITAIVNNVYLEIWLEFGIIAAVIFTGYLLYLLGKNFIHLIKLPKWENQQDIARLVLVFSLLAYCIQWLTFSPIFIMPIFIIIGLLTNLGD